MLKLRRIRFKGSTAGWEGWADWLGWGDVRLRRLPAGQITMEPGAW